MRTFAVTDIHGAHKALVQVLEKAKFDYKKDKLICIGDVCDRNPETKQCVDELLKIDNLIYIKGNHDQWVIEWMQVNTFPHLAEPRNESEKDKIIRELAEYRGDGFNESWIAQGGDATIESYKDGVPESHYRLLNNSYIYHIDQRRVFVHGGFNHREPISEQDADDLMWHRSMMNTARFCERDPLFKKSKLTEWEEVYVGHTPTILLDSFEPLNFLEIWFIDTGAGYGKKLSLIDIDSKEVYQSDMTSDLYPNSYK